MKMKRLCALAVLLTSSLAGAASNSASIALLIIIQTDHKKAESTA